MKISVIDEKILSQAPDHVDVLDWGPWQFPRLFDASEQLFLEFHVEADSAKSYGKPRKWLVSTDNGNSWEQTDIGGLLISGGDLIKPFQPYAASIKEDELPECIGVFSNYGFERKYYRYSDLPDKYKKWYIERKKPGGQWEVEQVNVELPNYTVNTSEGVFPLGYFHHFKLGTDGAIWGNLYKHYIRPDGKISDKAASWFLKSTDGGRNFKFASRVPYYYDRMKDPEGKLKYGYTEPDICFLDEKTGFALHRTTDGTGISPMYITWTKDGANTWSQPEWFDDRGVWPQTVLLDNGAIIAGYGREGLFIRPYVNGKWEDRIAIVEPSQYQTDTCSYCALTAIAPDTALIVYSDFQKLGPDGIPRKSIMSKRIRVEL